MDERIRKARTGLTEQGFVELKTAAEVDRAVEKAGTTLVFVNSICCCGEDVARPAMKIALSTGKKPNYLVSVFAGQEKEATEKAREYFIGYAPSSPAIALMKDGKICRMIERHELTTETPEQIALKLQAMFEAFC